MKFEDDEDWSQITSPILTSPEGELQAFYPYADGIGDGVWNFPYSILHIPYELPVFHTYGISSENC